MRLTIEQLSDMQIEELRRELALEADRRRVNLPYVELADGRRAAVDRFSLSVPADVVNDDSMSGVARVASEVGESAMERRARLIDGAISRRPSRRTVVAPKPVAGLDRGAAMLTECDKILADPYLGPGAKALLDGDAPNAGLDLTEFAAEVAKIDPPAESWRDRKPLL